MMRETFSGQTGCTLERACCRRGLSVRYDHGAEAVITRQSLGRLVLRESLFSGARQVDCCPEDVAKSGVVPRLHLRALHDLPTVKRV